MTMTMTTGFNPTAFDMTFGTTAFAMNTLIATPTASTMSAVTLLTVSARSTAGATPTTAPMTGMNAATAPINASSNASGTPRK